MKKNFIIILVIALCCIICPISVSAAVEVEILFVYDNTAKAWVDRNGGMQAFSKWSIDRLNEAMQNSNIEHRLKLSESITIDYNTISLYDDRENMRGGEGSFEYMHVAREKQNADLVVMYIDNGERWGATAMADGFVSWNSDPWDGDPENGYAVCAIQAVDTNWLILAHEIGHLFGAPHSKYQLSDPGPNERLEGAEYAAGWYFDGGDGNSYATIMSYTADGYGNYYGSAPLYSSPLLKYRGGIAGHPEHGDNRRLLNITMPIVAGYREANKSLHLQPVNLLLLN